MIRSIISFWLIACSAFAFSQQPSNTIAAEMNLRELAKLGKSLTAQAIGFDNRYEGVKGSPLVYDDWQNGTVQVTELRSIPAGVQLNINGFNNVVQVMIQGGILELENDKFLYALLETSSGDTKYQTYRKSRIYGKGEGKILLQVLFESERYSLLKEPKIRFKKADYQGAYSPDVRYDEFIPKPEYYLRVGKKYQKIKLKKKAVLKTLPEIRRTSAWDGTAMTEEKFVQLLTLLSESDQRTKEN